MITGNELITPIVIPGFVYGDGSSEPPTYKYGLTIRQHFASLEDVPWNAVLEMMELTGKYNKNCTVGEVLAYRARLKVLGADALIKELNKTQ